MIITGNEVLFGLQALSSNYQVINAIWKTRERSANGKAKAMPKAEGLPSSKPAQRQVTTSTMHSWVTPSSKYLQFLQ